MVKPQFLQSHTTCRCEVPAPDLVMCCCQFTTAPPCDARGWSVSSITDTQDNNMSLLFILHLICSVEEMEKVSKMYSNYKQKLCGTLPSVIQAVAAGATAWFGSCCFSWACLLSSSHHSTSNSITCFLHYIPELPATYGFDLLLVFNHLTEPPALPSGLVCWFELPSCYQPVSLFLDYHYLHLDPPPVAWYIPVMSVLILNETKNDMRPWITWSQHHGVLKCLLIFLLKYWSIYMGSVCSPSPSHFWTVEPYLWHCAVTLQH